MSAAGEAAVGVPEVEVAAGARAITMEDALREVLRRSLFHDGLARGLRECVKALDSQSGKLCVLAESCEEKEYLRLIEALCAEHNIPLLKVEKAEDLGTWVGLCKIDKTGVARKTVACACVVVCDFGEESEYLEFIMDHVRSQ